MLKEIPELRAPEKSRTGMEIKPKVRYPDQTEAAMFTPLLEWREREPCARVVSLDYNRAFGASRLRW
jgi:hypothetical protein